MLWRNRSATIPLTLLEGTSSFADRDSIGEIDDLAADVELLRAVLRGDRRHYAMEKRYIRHDGRVVWVQALCALLLALGLAAKIAIASMAQGVLAHG